MIAIVHEVILEHRWQTIHDDCDSIGPSYGLSQRILPDELNMRQTAAKYVLLLNKDHWDHRVQVCPELQKADRYDPNLMSRVITGDESWLYNDPETKEQYSQWKTRQSVRP